MERNAELRVGSPGEDCNDHGGPQTRDSPVREEMYYSDDELVLDEPTNPPQNFLDNSWRNDNLKLSSKNKRAKKGNSAKEIIDFYSAGRLLYTLFATFTLI